MAALNFPTSPSVNDLYSANGGTWRWNGTSWVTIVTPDVTDATGILAVVNGGTGATNDFDARVNLGAGDVNGPASATDNAVARFDSTTGKLLQNSVVTISDTGAITNAESISNIDFAQFDTTVTPIEAVGKLQWDDGNGTLQVGLKGGNVNLQVGQETLARVYNDAGVALTDGQIVYISGSQGNRIAVKLAKADSEATSAGTLGMVTEPIAIGAEGFITILGTVNKLNTAGLTAGSLLYLSATTAGAYTATKPTAPNHGVIIGYVERVDATVGSIYVKVDNGYELDELHNVIITSPTNGHTMIYDQAAGVWKNATLTAGTGVSVTNGTASITIANTGVTSITGTASQITASASTGGVTLSLPATINVNTSGSAATLTTARTINGTSFNGSANITTNSWGTSRTLTIGSTGKAVDGSAAVSWSLAEIGAQPVDADLTAIAGLAGTSGFLKKTATDTWSLDTNTYYLASNPSGYTTNTGTVTSVSGTGSYGGLTLTGTVTTSGSLTLGGTPTGTWPISVSGNAATASSAVKLSISDLRSTSLTPSYFGQGLNTAFMANSTDGLSDGGTYHGIVQIQQWTDASGGGAHQLAFTDNNNIWHRGSSGALTTWSSWYKVWDSNNLTNLNQLTNGPGYTTNTGTVTSVSGTGTVNGLTLSGTVTTSGNLTLSGSISISIDSITDEPRVFNNMGQNHTTNGDFNTVGDFGVRYIQTGTNGPTGVGSHQFYGFTLGLGNEYPLSVYASQFYWPRASTGGNRYIYVRDREGGTWGSWGKIYAGYADTAGNGGVTSVNGQTGAVTVSGGQYLGSAATKAIMYNSNTVSEDITISSGQNALSAGPVTISTGFTVTVSTGAVWVLV